MPPNPLKTRWGGTNQTHDPIIINPSNSLSDLELISEVLVQPFLSLQRHEYHYRAINNSDNTGANCLLRVEWLSKKVGWDRLAPGAQAQGHIRIISFFSPQLLQTTANVDVLAGFKTVVLARRVAGERAEAYVPWTSGIGQAAQALWKIVKPVLSLGETISVEATCAVVGGGTVRFRSTVKKVGDYFEYGYRVFNKTRSEIDVEISALRLVNRTPRFILAPGRTRRWVLKSEFVPNEVEGRFEYGVPARDEVDNAFPIPFLLPSNDRDVADLMNPMEFQPTALVSSEVS